MNIRNITLLVLILSFLLLCNNQTGKSAVQSNTVLNSKIDSTTAHCSNNSTEDMEPSGKELFNKSYNNLIKSYNNDETTDSVFIIGTDFFHVRMDYSCLKNTKVVVPKHFLVPYMNKDFSTHDFILKLIIFKNNESYFERTYEKKYFYKQLQNESLKQCGIIFSPYIEQVEENLVLSVSITIPLTDVGESVSDTLSLLNLRK